ncbi:MAG: response regulator [Rhodospirillales bacterium]|nr:response regulator [Rhodospirillales bacterium]
MNLQNAPQQTSNKRRKRLSITTRLLLLTFAIVMAGYILESVLHIRNDYAYRTASLNTHANLLADHNATVLAGPLWFSDHDAIAAKLDSLIKIPDVLGARLTQLNGDIIASIGSFGEGGAFARHSIEWTENGQTRLIGYFEIALNSSQADAVLLQGIFATAAIIVLLILVVMTSVFFAVRHLTQPLDALNELMSQLAEGRHDIVIGYLERDDEIGRVAHAVKTFRDNAVELEKLRNSLEQRVSEQTRDLRHAKEEAETANAAKSKFMSSMSHELRTPLNSIMGFAQLLELDAKKYADSPRYRDAVRHILSSSNQLLELIDQVLDFSKIETGNLEINFEDVSLDLIIAAVQETVKLLADRYNVSVQRSSGPCWSGLVHVDPLLLRQAIANLMSNAIKYNRPGGRVEFTCTRMAPERVRLVITDTGVGIAEEKHADLFQPFIRLGAEASTIEGTGIGLTITKKLLDVMGCAIDFESVVGTGSTFWIDMPISSDQTITQREPISPAPQNTIQKVVSPVADIAPPPVEPMVKPMGKPCVMYVEDSSANAALMQQYFLIIPGGPELIVASAGEEGVELARKHHPALILMDINLPGISGVEAMQQLRALADFAHTPIVAVSADAMPDEVSKAMAAGFDDYLTKPIKLSLLKEIMDRHLGAPESQA